MRTPSCCLAAALALALACGAPVDAPPAPAPGTLRVATWNVHDLFDEVDRTSPPGTGDEVPTHAEVEAKLARVGRVLAALDADVVILQEVENLALLQRLAAGPLAGRGYRAHLEEGFDPRGIDVGVLARVPVARFASHLADRAPDGSRPWARDLVEVHLDTQRGPIAVLGAHLVSRLDASADGRRLAQARAAREAIDAARALPGGPIVLLVGDLNDLPGSVPLAPLLSGGLVDLGASLADAGWTWSGGGARERLDYALVDPEHAGSITRVAVVANADAAAASDHRPLTVDLWLGASTRSLSGWVQTAARSMK